MVSSFCFVPVDCVGLVERFWAAQVPSTRMVYIRGNRRDYDLWRALGNEGWSYSDVLTYFKKPENEERGASAYHGTGGPLNVTDHRTRNPLSHAFVEAGVEAGLALMDDFNGSEIDLAGLLALLQLFRTPNL